jgi:hypothetical protein
VHDELEKPVDLRLRKASLGGVSTNELIVSDLY